MVSMQPPLCKQLDSSPGEGGRRRREGAGEREGADMLLAGGGLEPPTKRSRPDDASGVNGTLTTTPRPWKLRAVLGDDAIAPLPLVPAISARVTDKKQTSNLIRKLNEVLPLPSLQHLKRVKSYKDKDRTSIYLLLWREDEGAAASSVDHNCDNCVNSGGTVTRLLAAGVDVSHFSPEFRRERVAKFAPLTRQQFEVLKASPSYWPCNFHEDKYFESLVTSTHELWSLENRQLQEQYMLRAVRGGEEAAATGGCERGCGGLVVDPNTNTVIAQGHGTRGHPLHHTATNLLDLIARSQGGGAMDHTGTIPSLKFTNTTESNSSTNSGTVTVAAGGSPDSCDSPGEGERLPTAASHNHLKRYGSIAQLSSVPKTGPYLCTGYDVYLEREPCHMCSMALIHMRTRRVFYSRPTRDGALGTLDKIHTLEGLNHRFEVFTGILSSEEEDSGTLMCC